MYAKHAWRLLLDTDNHSDLALGKAVAIFKVALSVINNIVRLQSFTEIVRQMHIFDDSFGWPPL